MEWQAIQRGRAQRAEAKAKAKAKAQAKAKAVTHEAAEGWEVTRRFNVRLANPLFVQHFLFGEGAVGGGWRFRFLVVV